MAELRVLVVEDSLTVRKRLCEILGAEPDLRVVGETDHGGEAAQLCAELRPDVITLDMMLRGPSGLAATRQIMASSPTPILIVSASVNRAELLQTCEALAAGAVDVLEKPGAQLSSAEWSRQLTGAVRRTARVPVIRRASRALPTALPAARGRARAPELVAIGASAGGPAALMQILGQLPRELPWPLLVMLHLAEPFGSAFAQWFASAVPQRVVLAQDGATLESLRGVLALAPAGHHLLLQGGRLRLSDGPQRHGFRPSIDVLFESLAACGPAVVACLLTGMGADGARGLLAIRRAGGLTLAQDERSCAVYGMPREAALLGAAERVLALDEIGPALALLGADSFAARGATP
jgi:two-component system chemotaxis response regulator CheB